MYSLPDIGIRGLNAGVDMGFVSFSLRDVLNEYDILQNPLWYKWSLLRPLQSIQVLLEEFSSFP